jgi:hypothetical protein
VRERARSFSSSLVSAAWPSVAIRVWSCCNSESESNSSRVWGTREEAATLSEGGVALQKIQDERKRRR